MISLSAQKVVALLKRAGFPTAGPVRYSQEHGGYVCQRDGFRTSSKAGRIFVEHWFVGPNPDDYQKITAAKILEYKAVVQAAGLTAHVREIGGRPYWLEVS